MSRFPNPNHVPILICPIDISTLNPNPLGGVWICNNDWRWILNYCGLLNDDRSWILHNHGILNNGGRGWSYNDFPPVYWCGDCVTHNTPNHATHESWPEIASTSSPPTMMISIVPMVVIVPMVITIVMNSSVSMPCERAKRD